MVFEPPSAKTQWIACIHGLCDCDVQFNANLQPGYRTLVGAVVDAPLAADNVRQVADQQHAQTDGDDFAGAHAEEFLSRDAQ